MKKKVTILERQRIKPREEMEKEVYQQVRVGLVTMEHDMTQYADLCDRLDRLETRDLAREKQYRDDHQYFDLWRRMDDLERKGISDTKLGKDIYDAAIISVVNNKDLEAKIVDMKIEAESLHRCIDMLIEEVGHLKANIEESGA